METNKPNVLKNSEESEIQPKNEVADYRIKIEQRYNDKFEKAKSNFDNQLKTINEELEFYKVKLPQIKDSFVKNGGNLKCFEDYLILWKDKIDYSNIEKSVEESKRKTFWAFENKKVDSYEQLNNGTIRTSNLNLDELYPGTVYKKRG